MSFLQKSHNLYLKVNLLNSFKFMKTPQNLKASEKFTFIQCNLDYLTDLVLFFRTGNLNIVFVGIVSPNKLPQCFSESM